VNAREEWRTQFMERQMAALRAMAFEASRIPFGPADAKIRRLARLETEHLKRLGKPAERPIIMQTAIR